MVENKALVLAQYPVGYPVPGQDLLVATSQFDITTPPPGGVILKTNYVSYDPYLRGKMRTGVKSYTAGFQLNVPLDNNAISTVVVSDNTRLKKGDVVVGTSQFAEYVAISKERADKDQNSGGFSVLDNPFGLDPVIFLGALGMGGLTAYSSLYEIGKPEKGQTIFVSAASGNVGQLVGQLAKRAGLTVIGSVGNDEKAKFIKESLKFDAAFNYKTESPADGLARTLKELGKEGVDIYYDNGGGETLDAALAQMNTFGRIVSCGSVSQTSLLDDEKYKIANMPLVVPKRLTIRGFIVWDKDMGPKHFTEHQKNVQQWIKDGEIIVKTSITEGIDNAAQGFVEMLKGQNFGKAVLKIAEV